MSAFCCWVRLPKVNPEKTVIVSPWSATVILSSEVEVTSLSAAKVLSIFEKIKNKRKKNNGNLLIYFGISLFKF